MEIKTTVSQRVERVVEVEFPFYLSHWDSIEGSSWDVFSRIEESGRTVEVTKRDNGNVSWELSVETINLVRDVGEYLETGSRRHPCAAAEFDAALAELMAAAGLTMATA